MYYILFFFEESKHSNFNSFIWWINRKANEEEIDTVDDSETSVIHYGKDTKDFLVSFDNEFLFCTLFFVHSHFKLENFRYNVLSNFTKTGIKKLKEVELFL